MEAQSSQPNPVDTAVSSSFTQCNRCQQDSSTKSPKLLSCLHNFCSACLEEIKVSSASGGPVTDFYVCSSCQQTTPCSSASDNKFIAELIARSEASTEASKDHLCQGCEENVIASSFCSDCSDWLCDECVFAHKRVRVTKDHTIDSKHNVHEKIDPKARIEFCSIHPSETLKYFCPSCDALTCRDCQLHEHQKHDFRPVGQASDKHKSWLLQMADKLQNDVTTMEDSQTFIRQKIEEANEKERTESDKIKQFAIIFITEINRRGRAMLEDLKALCASKRAGLQKRCDELETILNRYRHTINFTEEIINNASNASLLQTRSLVSRQIMDLNKAEVHGANPRYRFDVAFGFNPHSVRELMSSLGQLTYNGQIFTGEHMKRRPPPPMMTQSSAGTAASTAAAAAAMTAGSVTNTTASGAVMGGSRPAQMMPPISGTVSSTGVPSTPPVQPQLSYFGVKPPVPPANSTPKPGFGQISSSTGSSTISPPQRQPDSASHKTSSNVTEQTIERQISADTSSNSRSSSGSQLDSKSFSFDEDPKKLLNVKVKREKRDDGYQTTSDVKTSDYASRSNDSAQQQAGASSSGTDHRQQSTDSGQTAQSPVLQRFGTVLSIPELGLEAESRTVYIPAGAPCPGPPTPRKHDSQDDPNEDWCAVCHDGGDLLCCGKCPKVFHYKCHVPEITVDPGDSWNCGLCADDDELRIESEPSRFVMVNGERKRKAPMGLLHQEFKACQRILLELFCHPNSVPFHEPVPKSTPLYYQIVRTPMDLKTIQSKLQPKHFNTYKSVQEFIDDVCLIFANCRKYNQVGSEVRDWGVMVETYFMELLQRLLPFVHLLAREESNHGEPSPKRQCTDADV